MIVRQGYNEVIRLAANFKAIAITGARQTGKSTLVKTLFPGKPYVSLENPDVRRYAIEDPRGFIGQFSNGAVLDEVQRTPELFSYLQEVLDRSNEKAQFILTGSNNFLLQESISQSLAGRIAFFQLPTFSIQELHHANWLLNDEDDLMIKGCFPPVYDQQVPSPDWSRNYISTYIEKDIRQLRNINDLFVFERFLSLLAGRCGQELNASALALEAGVDVKTIQAWIGLLEASYVVFLLRPHHKSFNKTIVKRPKIYFTDTAIVCSLLRITEKNHLINHPLRGAIFENFVVMELRKVFINAGKPSPLFYWRDKTGHEIDIILDDGMKLIPIEIKSGKTIGSGYVKNIHYWMKLSKAENAVVLYAGEEQQTYSENIKIINWRNFVLNNFG